MSSRRLNEGQMLLVTLLVLTVAMTIALSVIARSTKNVSISTNVEESARAFSAAEAGVEQALKTGSGGAQTLQGVPATYNANVQAVGAATGAYAFPDRTLQGETQTLWLVNHLNDRTLDESTPFYRANGIDVCWKGTGGTVPALSVIVLYKRGGNYEVARTAYDPNASRRASNGFVNGGALGAGCGQSSVYRRTVSFVGFSPPINPASDILLALRVRPFYADADLYVSTQNNWALPSQGNLVTSVGSTGTGVTRKIQVSQQYRFPPSLFDAAVISQTSFSH